MEKTIFFLIILFLFSVQEVYARQFSVGVSPSLINLDEISQGSSKPISFFIVTVSDETLLVYLEPREALIDFFDNPNYKNYLFNYSEEPTSGWIQTFSNPVELKPEEGIRTLGGTIKGWREINFLLNIPEDAEPGYHLVRIFPKPALPTGSLGQVGVQIAALTPLTVLFNIPGKSIRQGKILDVTLGRLIGNNLELLIHFLNTGTVTISARANDIKIYKDGNSIANLTSETKKIKPGEKQTFTALLPLNGIEPGEYDVYTKVNFLTDETEKISKVKIYPEVVVAPPPPVVPKPIEIPPWLIILIAFILISILIYKRRV